MRITILHRYFWPQNYPYARMLKDIAEALKARGHDVLVMTSRQGGEDENAQREEWTKHTGISIDSISLGSEKRLSLVRKALNSLYFGLGVLFKLFSGRQEIVLVATTPPVVIAALVRWVGRIRGFRYVYHCQDIHPEAMLINGYVKKGFLYQWLRAVDIKNVQNAWKVITLSGDMRDTFKARGNRIDHIQVINNFIFEASEPKGEMCCSSGKVRFLFAGSLGRLQNLELLVDSLQSFRDDDRVEFVFMGDGVLYKRLIALKNQLNLRNVEFTGQRSMSEAVEAMRESDVGIVSLSKGICRVAYPSKSVMYLGNGLPLLALVDEQTELMRLVNNNDLGLAVEPSSTKSIAAAIETMIDRLMKNPISRRHVHSIAMEHFGREKILKRFVEVFDDE